MKNNTEISDLISQIWDSKNFEISEQDAVSKINEEIQYITPKLKTIHKNESGSIIIVSAPGAVGKTTFAKYFSKIKKGYYWDLSKIKLGDNSFIGTVAKVHGSSNLTNFLDAIGKGEVCLFLDAFDEAEIRSGLDGIEKFVEEVYNYSKSSIRPNIVFFSRSETAEYLHLKLMEVSDCEDFSVYEIEYFDQSSALHFIKKEIEKKQDNSPNIHPIPFEKAVNAIFNSISKGMNEITDPWNDPNTRSFIGYAPVLQTIGNFLQGQNYGEVENNFSSQDTIESGIKVISNFIEQLLVREQLKLISPLKNELSEIEPLWSNWDLLFSSDEQIKIILHYVIYREVKVFPSIEVPKWLEQNYKDSVQNFLPNHPFLKSRNYSSPAFRDYSLAKLLFTNEFTNISKSYISSGDFALTQLFTYFYSISHDSICLGEHVGFLYESASAKKKLADGILFTYIEKGSFNNYTIEIVDSEGDKSANFCFECLLDDENPLVFERRLVNAEINIDSVIIFGKPESSIEFADVNVKAKKIIFKANECFFNCYDDSTILQAENVVEDSGILEVKKVGDQSLEVNWPNSQVFPWSEYHNDIYTDIETDPEYQVKIYALQRILSPFRKHKRKEFAKHSDYIENVIVGSSTIRKSILQLLLNKEVLKKENSLNQFIVNEEKLSEIGITWDNIKKLTSNIDIREFLKTIS